MKKFREAPGRETQGRPRTGVPLVSDHSAAARNLAAARDDDGRIAIIAEVAAEKDPSAIPMLARIYTDRESDESVAEAASDAIAGMGGSAVPALLGLIRISRDDFERRSLKELACRIAGGDIARRVEAGDPQVVDVAVRLFADTGTDDGVADAVLREIVGKAGLGAIPRLIRIAETAPELEVQDCAINFLFDIARRNRGSRESLDSVPMLVEKLKGLDSGGIPQETVREILAGGGKAAAALLIMRTEHPELSIASSALDLIRELWEQFPGEPRIAGSVHVMLEGMGTRDPILGLALREAIKEVGGFEPPLIAGPKIEG